MSGRKRPFSSVGSEQARQGQPFDVKKLEIEYNSNQLKESVLNLVNNTKSGRWRPFQLGRVPGPMPISILRSNLNVLTKYQYWVAEKSDGDRYLLFYSSKRKQCYLIGRKFNLHKVPGDLLPQMFAGGGDSLLDGEIVQELVGGQERPAYLVFDIVAFRGVHIGEEPLSKRLQQIGRAVGEYRKLEGKGSCPFVIQSKTFYKKEHVSEMLKKIERKVSSKGHVEYWFSEKRSAGLRRNRNDGIIFTPETGGYMQRHSSILKWKFLELNTIDVQIQQRDIRNYNQKKLPVYCKGRNPSGGQAVNLFLREIPMPANISDYFPFTPRSLAPCPIYRVSTSAIVEIGYDKNKGQWVIHRARPDKGQPNFITTCMGTLDALIDNVSTEALKNACKKQ